MLIYSPCYYDNSRIMNFEKKREKESVLAFIRNYLEQKIAFFFYSIKFEKEKSLSRENWN